MINEKNIELNDLCSNIFKVAKELILLVKDIELPNKDITDRSKEEIENLLKKEDSYLLVVSKHSSEGLTLSKKALACEIAIEDPENSKLIFDRFNTARLAVSDAIALITAANRANMMLNSSKLMEAMIPKASKPTDGLN